MLQILFYCSLSLINPLMCSSRFIPVLTVCLLYFCSPHKDKNPSESCPAGQGGGLLPCWHQWSTTEERTKVTYPWSPQQMVAGEGLETSFSQALD